MNGSEAKLEAIRRILTRACEAPWRKLLATTAGPDGPVVRADHLGGEAPEAGSCYALERVDPTRQDGVEGDRLVHHDQSGITWGLRLDPELLTLMERARELQASFGFPHRARWDVVGAFVERVPIGGEDDDEEPEDEGEGEDEPQEVPEMVILRPLAIRVRDQLMIDARSPVVPGLVEAEKALAELHAPIVVPTGAPPAQLLATLLQTLDLNCWPRFRELWVEDATASEMRFRWDQFRDAWRTSGGRIAFARYDTEPAADAPDGTRVKLFVTRGDGADHTWTRPLTFARLHGQWRLETGIL
ncbi:MAG: hypothetical protein EP329_22070 [Deltaproteobacteria bacterium]|nr:MAG: hypothetical protein EP329_22070 [Deltaproteobacteria bacterium]